MQNQKYNKHKYKKILTYFDNFFTTYKLMKNLREKNNHACGTVSVTKKYMPSFKSDKRAELSEYKWFIRNDGIAAIKWKDKRSLHVLLNFH